MSARYRCPVCRKRVAVYVPSKGDGSAVFFKRHKNGDDWCKGWGVEAEDKHREETK